ncbi:MAG: non-canonical purine NTP pyrophosphatase, RdgB/HAM1 family [Proteobacteria bacterium]|nr:MAG: non-canonical purine NTP pyrophosphatase, RdgB/HAM1 family [Pseudomonadota bacterium]
MKKLVLASNNEGKIREIRPMLASLGIEVIPQAHYGVAEAPEPHGTFVENALAKARHVAASTGLPALADDSGICVDALAGAPGVHSARFAGEPKSDERNNDRLLEVMVARDDRSAHYYCVIVLMRHAADPQPLIAEGEWHGMLLRERRGTGGFGYDPLFLDLKLGQTGAELSIEHKNRISHRGKAIAVLLEKIKGVT